MIQLVNSNIFLAKMNYRTVQFLLYKTHQLNGNDQTLNEKQFNCAETKHLFGNRHDMNTGF